MCKQLSRDNTIEAFRVAVLRALDKTSEVFGVDAMGASDSDLPALFCVIDAHVEKLADRYNVALVDRVQS